MMTNKALEASASFLEYEKKFWQEYIAACREYRQPHIPHATNDGELVTLCFNSLRHSRREEHLELRRNFLKILIKASATMANCFLLEENFDSESYCTWCAYWEECIYDFIGSLIETTDVDIVELMDHLIGCYMSCKDDALEQKQFEPTSNCDKAMHKQWVDAVVRRSLNAPIASLRQEYRFSTSLGDIADENYWGEEYEDEYWDDDDDWDDEEDDDDDDDEGYSGGWSDDDLINHWFHRRRH